MKKNINIGIIGCGRISGWHCRSISSNPNINLVAVCDLDIEKANTYAKEYNAKAYASYREMLESNPEINLVSIITPSGMHYEHAAEIIKDFKKNIVVEKPTFMKPSQVIDAYELAKKNNLQIFPVFQNRYNLAVQRVKKAIDNKELGEIRIISVRVRWCRPQKYYDMSDWRGTYSHDGGALTNQGIHHLDLLRYLGGEIESVNSSMSTLGVEIPVEDTVVGIFKYKDGSIGNLEVTTAARPDDFEASISIVGSKGLAKLGGVAVNMLETFTPSPEECNNFSDDFSTLPDRGKVYGTGHIEFYNDIEKYFNNNIPFPVNESDCLSSIKLLHAFYCSSEKENWVKIKDSLESKRLGEKNEEISNLYRIKK